MGNLVALATVVERGDEIILERQCHVFNYEVASVAALAGAQLNALDGERGVLSAEVIAPHIRPENLHAPRTRVIAVENTHNRAGGRVYPFDEMRRIKALAEERGLLVHLDGARICNAHVASGVALSDYGACCDTLSMCFSKGLGAPVGSIVVSTRAVIDRARKVRKRLGGGMRQAGILAAAALYALDHNIERLREDHENARRLAAFVEGVEGLRLAHPVETNIVVCAVDGRRFTVPDLLARLEREGVRAVPFGAGLLRMVTHLDVSAADIARVGEVLAALAR
jgi:threonine aldolase